MLILVTSIPAAAVMVTAVIADAVVVAVDVAVVATTKIAHKVALLVKQLWMHLVTLALWRNRATFVMTVTTVK